MRLPDDPNPEPPGGRSAERLREFIDAHKAPGADNPERVEDGDLKKPAVSPSVDDRTA